MAFTWNQVRDVVDAVLDLPRGERAHYLDQACPEPALRLYVDSLILSYDQAGSFLQEPPVGSAALECASQAEWWLGQRLGPYRLTERIGEGGMGFVFRALRADDQYDKEVAIKVVKPGYESAFALGRFRAERQILANLEHTNIARLLDGGTTEQGLPYFVMELVDGVPIDEYCDSHRLSLAERLRLFLGVCSAVEYAHQNLVVHRDLKPGNILITRSGVPKLLDFGIAKILAPEPTTRHAEASVAFLRMLTPEYASPEQLNGSPLTTSTDVYSLGVVLYVLLAGRHPYRVDGQRLDDFTRAIAQSEPRAPSAIVREGTEVTRADGTLVSRTPEAVSAARAASPARLRRQLASDLDNIALMALRKDPQRRYRSVAELSEDIRRHLEGLPVRACRETLRYRARKFLARNRAAVAASILVLLALLAGLLTTLYEARLARAQQARAERRFQDVRALANSLMFEVHDGIANLAGATAVRKLLVERAIQYLDDLAKESRGDRSLELELAAAYDKIGDVQGQPHEGNLGDPASASVSYQKALAIRESLAQENPADQQVLGQLTTSYMRLSDLLWNRGDNARALAYARRETPLAERLFAVDSGAQNRLLLAWTHVDQGYKEAMLGGDRARGLQMLGDGSAMLEQILSGSPDDFVVRRKLALSYGRVGEIQRIDSGKDPEALAAFRQAAATLEPLMSRDPDNAEIRRISAYYHTAIGELLSAMNQLPAALAEERGVLASLQALQEADPSNATLRVDAAKVRYVIGRLLVESGDARGAIPLLQESLQALDKMADAKRPASYVGYVVIEDERWLGKASASLASSAGLSPEERAEHCRRAQSWLRLALPQFESLSGRAAQFTHAAADASEIRQELSSCPASLRPVSSAAAPRG